MDKLTTLLSKETITKIEKYITLFIYYILPIIVIVTLISAMTSTNNMGFSRQEVRGSRGRGLLAIILFIKPITFLGKKYLKAESITLKQFLTTIKDLPKTIKNGNKNINEQVKQYAIPFIINIIYSISLYLMRLRRPLGIATFWLLLTHGLLWQIFRIRQGFPLFFNLGESTILYGILGLLSIITVAITSNDYALKRLKRNRKKIQMIAYLAFFFGAIHTGNTFWLIVYFVLKFFERRDTGMLKIRAEILNIQRNKIKNNKWLNKQLNIVKNNKRITDQINKINK